NFGVPNKGGDRRALASTKKESFKIDEFFEIDIAYIFARNSLNDATNTRAVVDLQNAAKEVQTMFQEGIITETTKPPVEKPVSSAIYPNPLGKNQSMIIREPELTKIEIYDLSGKLVLTKRGEGYIEINHYELSQGMYVLRLFSTGEPRSEKLAIR